MESPRWWLLFPALMAMDHCLALVDQKDSDPIDTNPRDVPPRPALPCHKLSVSNIDFAFNLYRQLAWNAPGENILFSPASISSALATLFLGAPAASRAQLLEGLGLNLSVVPEAEVQEAFQDLLLRLPLQGPRLLLTVGQRRFHSLGPGAGQDPGEGQKCIREYVETQTQGKLGAWVEDLGNETAAVLVNHVLLQAGWATPFDLEATSPKEFFVDELRTVQVPMMRQKARHRFLHDPELQCTVLQMDHAGAGNVTTFFVFPSRGALGQLEDALLPETLIKWDSLLRTRELNFHFPKFSISSTSRLELLLPRGAVGGGLPGQPGLNVSRVTHKAVMTLGEEGSEAAAATSIQLTPSPHPDFDSTPPPDTEFRRPFLVMTFHTETGSMLFLGKIMIWSKSSGVHYPKDGKGPSGCLVMWLSILRPPIPVTMKLKDFSVLWDKQAPSSTAHTRLPWRRRSNTGISYTDINDSHVENDALKVLEEITRELFKTLA